MTWRLLAKALGEKASDCDHESDRVAVIRLAILACYLITNCFIIAGVIRHWRIENPAHPAVRNAECPGDGGTSHATTSHEVDQIAVEGILISHVARQFG